MTRNPVLAHRMRLERLQADRDAAQAEHHRALMRGNTQAQNKAARKVKNLTHELMRAEREVVL